MKNYCLALVLVLLAMLGNISAQPCGSCPLGQTCGGKCACNWPNCVYKDSVPEEKLDDNLTVVINALKVLKATDMGDVEMMVEVVKILEPYLDGMADAFSALKVRNQYYREFGIEV